jgi:hypothetical protein
MSAVQDQKTRCRLSRIFTVDKLLVALVAAWFGAYVAHWTVVGLGGTESVLLVVSGLAGFACIPVVGVAWARDSLRKSRERGRAILVARNAAHQARLKLAGVYCVDDRCKELLAEARDAATAAYEALVVAERSIW